MPDRRFPVTFVPAGVTAWAKEGDTVAEVARRAGVLVPVPCGGRGVCGKCGVKILDGTAPEPSPLESRGLGAAPPGVRLACLCTVGGPMTVRPVVISGSSTSDDPVEIAEEAVLAAVDFGTTTVEAVVFGVASGRELGRGIVPNEQQAWGADVVARVAAAQGGELSELRAAGERSVVAALDGACGSAGACLAAVTRLVVAANSVMASTLLGEDLGGFEAHPFMSPVGEARPLPQDSQILDALPKATPTTVLPSIASFVGGDVLAGLLTAGLIEGEQTGIYVDAGTNAEVVVVARSGAFVSSAAAGPALEGFGISCGGPAAVGGVRGITISDTGDIAFDVIGGGDGQWLTGSGLFSAIAALKRLGHIAGDGAMREQGPLSRSFERFDGVLGVKLSDGPHGGITVLQTDVRSFQSAKAALSAGILATVRAAKAKPKGLERLVMAGGLGSATDADDLVELGVVPVEFAGRIESVGNASLTGAAMMASADGLIDDAVAAFAGSAHVELASDPGFTASFVDALALEPYSLKSGFKSSRR